MVKKIKIQRSVTTLVEDEIELPFAVQFDSSDDDFDQFTIVVFLATGFKISITKLCYFTRDGHTRYELETQRWNREDLTWVVTQPKTTFVKFMGVLAEAEQFIASSKKEIIRLANES